MGFNYKTINNNGNTKNNNMAKWLLETNSRFQKQKKKKTIDYLNETLDDTYSLNKLDQ